MTSDKDDIIELTVAYCWALDTRQYDDLDAVFLPDATAELGRSLDGLDAIKGRIAEALDPLDASQHMVGHAPGDGRRRPGHRAHLPAGPARQGAAALFMVGREVRRSLRAHPRRLAHRAPRARRCCGPTATRRCCSATREPRHPALRAWRRRSDDACLPADRGSGWRRHRDAGGAGPALAHLAAAVPGGWRRTSRPWSPTMMRRRSGTCSGRSTVERSRRRVNGTSGLRCASGTGSACSRPGRSMRSWST